MDLKAVHFHADDYGMFVEQSRRILECSRNGGSLNEISVFSNGDDLKHCLEMLEGADLRLTVHLNLIQGHCISEQEKVNLLTNDEGIFHVGFLKLLFCVLTGKRNQYKMQIKIELSAQIQYLLKYIESMGQPLQLDGHAHWHMIPVVFDAMMELIQEDNLPVTYVRIPSERFGVYAKHFFHVLPVAPINIVKVLILNILAARNRHKWKAALSGMDQRLFMGVLLSGNFTLEKMRRLLPTALRYAEKKGQELEILAHPGAVCEQGDLKRITNSNDYRFFTSVSRYKEADALCKIKMSQPV